MTSSGHLYLWIGLDVHPIYRSDALALAGMVAELRNWSHRSLCRLMSLQGEKWVAQSQASREMAWTSAATRGWTGACGGTRLCREKEPENATSRTEVGLLQSSRKRTHGCTGAIMRWIKQPRVVTTGAVAVGLTLTSQTYQHKYVSSRAIRYMSDGARMTRRGRALSGGRVSRLAPWARPGLMRWHA